MSIPKNEKLIHEINQRWKNMVDNCTKGIDLHHPSIEDAHQLEQNRLAIEHQLLKIKQLLSQKRKQSLERHALEYEKTYVENILKELKAYSNRIWNKLNEFEPYFTPQLDQILMSLIQKYGKELKVWHQGEEVSYFDYGAIYTKDRLEIVKRDFIRSILSQERGHILRLINDPLFTKKDIAFQIKKVLQDIENSYIEAKTHAIKDASYHISLASKLFDTKVLTAFYRQLLINIGYQEENSDNISRNGMFAQLTREEQLLACFYFMENIFGIDVEQQITQRVSAENINRFFCMVTDDIPESGNSQSSNFRTPAQNVKKHINQREKGKDNYPKSLLEKLVPIFEKLNVNKTAIEKLKHKIDLS